MHWASIRRKYSTLLARLMLFAACAIVGVATGCSEQPATTFQGYVEGEFVLVASPLAGELHKLAVHRGEQVAAGAPLFILNQEKEKAAAAAARQEVQRAASHLEDLRKGGRPSELRAIEAQLRQARAAADLAEKEFARRQKLLKNGDVAVEEFDRASAALDQKRAEITRLQAQFETMRLGARTDVIRAGEAELAGAEARLTQAEWALAQKAPRAQQHALVFDTLYEPGEFVRAGYPIVSLLPPGNIVIRFFVPEPLLGHLQVGQPLSVEFDGGDTPLPATISFISPQAEYTPPVIYSRDTRSKLVFLVEAHPAAKVAVQLHPGQPVDVHLGAPP